MLMPGLLIPALLLSPPDTPRVLRPECRVVNGEITAVATRVSPSLSGLRIHGQSNGDLDGELRLDVVKPIVGGSVQIAFRITMPGGQIDVRGRSALSRHAVPHQRRVEGSLEVVGGTGAFASLRGRLETVGSADTRARSILMTYTGEVCSESRNSQQNNAVDTATRTARRNAGNGLKVPSDTNASFNLRGNS